MLTSAQPGASGAATERAILDAARSLYLAEGLAGVSARKIARAVGCSPTAIYLYYDSVPDLLHRLRMEGHAMLAAYLARPAKDLHAVERLLDMQRQYFRFGTEHPDYFRLMFPTQLPAAPSGNVYAEESFSLDVVREAAELGVRRGELRASLDAVLVANVGWMQVHGLTSMVVAGHAAATAPGRESELLEALLEATEAWLRG